MKRSRLLLAVPLLLTIGCAADPPLEDETSTPARQIAAREKLQTETITATGTRVLSSTDYYTITGTVTGTVKLTSPEISWTGTSTNTTTNTRTTSASGPVTSSATYSQMATNTVTNSRNRTATKVATAAVTGYTTFTGTTVMTATNSVTVTSGARRGVGTKTVTAVGTGQQTGTALWTWTDTVVNTYTLTNTDTATGTSTPAACLTDWRGTTCGQACDKPDPNQKDLLNCQQFLECYRVNNCGPSTCGAPDAVCGVNVIRPAMGSAPKDLADAVYQCLACPGSTPATSCSGKPDNTPCASANPCIKNRCWGGKCVLSTPVTCQPADQCHLAGTCNPSTGLCDNPAKPEGSPCEDGLFCTINDTCRSGRCQAGEERPCPPPAPGVQCRGPASCVEAVGNCVYPPLEDGTACDDHQLCTEHDACKDGGCKGDPVICDSPGQCLKTPTCDPTLRCDVPPVPKDDGDTCDDGKACTQQDACLHGSCVGTETCPAPDQCQEIVTCDIRGDCKPIPKADFTQCDDGDPATAGETCQGGACVFVQKWTIKIVNHNGGQQFPFSVQKRLTSDPTNVVATRMAVLQGTTMAATFAVGPNEQPFFTVPAYGGRAASRDCHLVPSVGATPEYECTVDIGIAITLTVDRDGNAAPGVTVLAFEVSSSHITTLSVDGANESTAVTDNAGQAVLLMAPGRTYSFATLPQTGVVEAYNFSRHACFDGDCECDSSRCKVTGSSGGCTSGTIHIEQLDPTTIDATHRTAAIARWAALPSAESAGSATGGNTGYPTSTRFMSDAQDRLLSFAADQTEFDQLMKTSFGSNVPQTRIDQLRGELLANNFQHALPPVRFIEHERLNNHMGAFSKDTNFVYISTSATAESSRRLTYAEEIGHFIANFLREGLGEQAGSEGDLFYLLLIRTDLSQQGKDHLMSQDDHGSITLHDGTTISVRYSIWSTIWGAATYVYNGVSEIASGGTYMVLSTIYKQGASKINGFLYSTTIGVGKLVNQKAIQLTGAALNKFNKLLNSYGLGWATEWTARLSLGALSTERLSMAYESLATYIQQGTESMDRVNSAIQKMGSGDLNDLKDGTADLVMANLQFTEEFNADVFVGIPALLLSSFDDILFAGPPRTLTSEEIKVAKPIFCGSIDYDRVQIKEKNGLFWGAINHLREDDDGNPRAVTIDNVINTFGVDDPDHSTFVHEMTHIWQYQNAGPIYKAQAIHYELIVDPIGGTNQYHWFPAVEQGVGWPNLGAEAQAQFVEDAFYADESPLCTNKNFWPEKAEFIYLNKNYTSKAWEMANDVVQGFGGPKGLTTNL
jgi:hypothetical protein